MRRAFTLVEVIATLAVTAVIAGMLALRAGALMESIHMRGAVAEVVEAFSVARAAAVRRSDFTTVKIDASTGAILVLADDDTLFTAPVQRRYSVSVRSNRDSMVFTPLGMGYGAGNQTIILAGRKRADTLIVSRLGRVRH